MAVDEKTVPDYWDLLTHAPSEPRLCKVVFGFLRRHRDALGLPIGSTVWPYFFITNDMCEVFFGALDMVVEHEEALDEDEVRTFRLRAWAAFLESYHSCSADRCHGIQPRVWHSIPKGDLLAYFERFQCPVEA